MSPASGGETPPGQSVGVLRRANVTLIGAGLGGVLAIANEIACARYLGVSLYGLYALALVLARVAEGVANFGMPVGALHLVSIYRDQGETRQVLGTIWASLAAPLLVGLAFAGILGALAPVIAIDVFGNPLAIPYIRAMALAIPFMGLSEVAGVVTRGFGHAGYYVLARNVVPHVVFMASLFAIVSSGADPVWASRAFCAAYVVAALAGLAFVLRVTKGDLLRVRPSIPFRRLYAYSLPILANNLLYLVIACTPLLMLGVMQTDREAGIYRACMQLMVPFDMFVMAFNAAVGHLYPVLQGSDRREELAALVERITRWLSLPALGLLLVITLNPHDLLLLMGPDFTGGALALAVLAFGHAILCATGSAAYLLVMSGRQKYETFNAALAAVLCTVLNIALIGSLGAVGAALSTTLACLLISILRVAQVRRLMAIRIVGRRLAGILGLAAATAIVVSLAMALLPIGEGRGFAMLAFRLGAIMAIFTLSYWFVGLRSEDRRAATQALRGRFPGRSP